MSSHRLWNIFLIALRNAVRFRLQSSLMVFAASLGVAGVLVSTGYADGGRQKILERFQRLGTNVVSVTPRQSRTVGGRARTGAVVQTLSESDYKAIKANIEGIEVSSATLAGTFRVRAGDFTKTTAIVGCEPEYFRMKHWISVKGAQFDDADMHRQARVALLGYTAAKDLFGANDPTGLRITINRVPFVVAGVLAERGQSLDAANEDNQIYVPLPTLMHRLMNASFYASIQLELGSQANMGAAAARITQMLQRRHAQFSPGGDDFQVQNQNSLIDTQLATFGRLSFLINWIGASTVAVSGLGIWGICWISVRNRTREIGARRAIGATRSDVLVQFLSEASTCSLLGCFVGIFVAYSSIRWLDIAVDQPFTFEWRAALWNVCGAAVLFATFAVISSKRASTLDPIVGLRAE